MSTLEWGYTETNGPDTWASKYPTAAGSRQSPVDIITSLATSDTSLDSRPLTWTFVPENTRAIVNTGYGWRVDIDGEGSGLKRKASEDRKRLRRPRREMRKLRSLKILDVKHPSWYLSGGPLEDSYQLEQFHCHWGSTSDQGSEHTVDGVPYAGELHLVHWNRNKYSNCGEAAGFPDGLAVLGVLLKVGEENPEMQKIVDLIPSIYHRGDRADITEPIDPTKLLPETFSYWTYLGSLTTPPCSESVTWIVFKEPIEVSEEQLAAFRNLKCFNSEEASACDDLEGLLINNFRPPLPLGNRELRECGSA